MEIHCTKCDEVIEAGAAFCGNCGQAVSAGPGTIAKVLSTPTDATLPVSFTPAAANGQPIPAYAIPNAGQQSGSVKATMSVVFGVLGIIAAVILPILGLGFGVIGIVLSTLSHRAEKHWVSRLGIGLSILTVVISLANWAYVISHDPRFSHQVSQQAQATSTVQQASSITTPCYTAKFPRVVNVQNNAGSCNTNIFDGTTFDTSHDGYKIYAANSSVTGASFMNLAQQAILKDVAQSLPAFTVTQQGPGTFSGSPAYFVVTTNNSGVSVIEAATLHSGSSKTDNNFYVLVHAINGGTASLDTLQNGWEWQ